MKLNSFAINFQSIIEGKPSLKLKSFSGMKQAIKLKSFFIGCICFLTISTSSNLFGQSTVGAGQTYTTLKAAFDAINNGVLTGNVVLQINGNCTETATASLNASGTGSANYTSVNIYPTGGIRTISANITNMLIALTGADNVTIDGRLNGSGVSNNLIIQNTGAAAYGGVIKLWAGAMNNTIQYSTLKSSGGDVIAFDGIEPLATYVDLATGYKNTVQYINSNNVIQYNDITQIGGTAPNTGVSASNLKNVPLATFPAIHNNNTIKGNNFYDLGSKYWIESVLNCNNWEISQNSFYQTSPITVTTGTCAFIYLFEGSSGALIHDNFFGGTASNASGGKFNITLANGSFECVSGQTSGVVTVENNVFSKFNVTHSNSQVFSLVNFSSTGQWIVGSSGKGNLFGSLSANDDIVINSTGASSGSIRLISNFSSNTSSNISYNSFGGITLNYTGTTISPDFILVYTSSSTGKTSIDNNVFGNLNAKIKLSGSVKGIDFIFIDYNSQSAANIVNNSFQHFFVETLTSSATSNDYSIVDVSNSSFAHIISNNVFGNSTDAGNMSFNIYTDMYIIKSDGNNSIIENNIFQQFVAQGTCEAIAIYSGGTSTLIQKNTIQQFSATGSDGGFNGINIYSGSPVVQKNIIQNITVMNGNLYGIVVGSSSNTNIFNNIVLLNNGGNSPVIRGIMDNSNSNKVLKVYHNTVKISGTATSGANNSNAFTYIGLVGSPDIRNNIFQNVRTNSGATASHISVRYDKAGPGTFDFNWLEASGVSGAVLGVWNGVNQTTLSGFQGASSKATNCKTGTINIVATGHVTNYNKNNVQNTGDNLQAIVPDDYSTLGIRPTCPWMGAFEGITYIPVFTVTITPGANICSGGSAVFDINVVDDLNAGLPCYVYYTINGGAELSVQTDATGYIQISLPNSTSDVTLTVNAIRLGACRYDLTPPQSKTITVKPASTISLTSATVSPSVCVNTPITNITYSVTGATGVSYSGLPTGVSGSLISSNSITISGTPTVAGTYPYIITLTGGCSVVTQTGTIYVGSIPAPTIAPISPFCVPGSVNLAGTIGTNSIVPLSFSNTSSSSIPDGGITNSWNGLSGTFASSSIAVSGLTTGWDFTSVSVNVSNKNDGDVIAYLYNPCLASIKLINQNGGAGVDFTNTAFSPTALTSISTITSTGNPFTNTYIPADGAGALTTFITSSKGCATVNGSWTLKVGDITSRASGAGTLNSWSLNFTKSVAPTFAWTPTTNMTNSTTLTPTVTPTVAGTTIYTLTETNGYNCSNTATVSVIATNPPVLPAFTGPTSLCIGENKTLVNATTGGTWTSSNTSKVLINAATGQYSGVAAGTSKITYTVVSAGCTSTRDTIVTVNAYPIVSAITGPLTLCPSTSIQLLDATSSGVWSSGSLAVATINSSTGFVTGVAPGTSTIAYTVTSNGCATTVSQDITVNVIPTVTVNDKTICLGANATLTATPSALGGTYLWNIGGTNQTNTQSPSVSTNYSVVYTLGGCASIADTGRITVNPIPTVTFDSPVTCPGVSTTLTATPSILGGTFAWTNGATGASINVAPLTTTSYTLIYTSVDGCPSILSTGTVTVNPKPSLTVNSPSICPGSTANLIANPSIGGGTCNWSNSVVGLTNDVTPSTSTVYKAVYTSSLGCKSDTASATVTVYTKPTLIVNSPSICLADSVELVANPSVSGGTYLWSNGATSVKIKVSPAVTTNYWVYYSSVDGCKSDTVTSTVTIKAKPIVSVSSVSICPTEIGTLTATPVVPGGTYAWSNSTSASSINVSPSVTTTYKLVYTLDCASDTMSGTVTVKPTPTLTVNSPSICPGQTANLIATPSIGGGVCTWSNSIVGLTNDVTPIVTTIYKAVYTSVLGCKSDTVSSTVTLYSKPGLTVNSPSICLGDSVELIASPSILGGTYLWSNGATSTKIKVSPATATNYWVFYSSGLGCKSDTITSAVTIKAKPIVTVNSVSICPTEITTLTATPVVPGGTYSWSNGTSGQSINVSPSVTTTYKLVYTLDCPSDTMSGTITVNPKPTLSVNSPTICPGQTANLVANPSIPGGVCNWSNSIIGLTNDVNPIVSTVYKAVYTSALGCKSDTALATVSLYTKPIIAVNSPSICPGDSVELITTPTMVGGTFEWSNASTASKIKVSPAITTNYWVYYTSTDGCESDTMRPSVTVNAKPNVTVAPVTICNGNTAQLTAIPSVLGGSYKWSTNETTSFIDVTPHATQSYHVIYTSICPSDTAFVSVTVDPGPTVSAGLDTSICVGGTASLTATPSVGGGTYLWNDGITGATRTVNPLVTTSYSVIYTNVGCSSLADTVKVKVNSLPEIDITPPQICAGASATLEATPKVAGGTFLWSDNSTASTLTVTPLVNTTYTVVYTLAGCSSLTKSGEVKVVTPPTVSVAPVSVCKADSVLLTAIPSAGGGTYDWMDGATGATRYVSPTTTTTYSVAYKFGCVSDTMPVTVTVNNLPTITVNSDTICKGESSTLTAVPSVVGGTYLWGDLVTGISRIVSPIISTDYPVVYTDGNGCKSVSVIGKVKVNAIPTITVDSLTICPGNNATLTTTPSIVGGTYVWEDATTLATLSVTPLLSKSYSVIYTSPDGCQSLPTLGYVTLSNKPTVSVTADTSICSGKNIQLNATSPIVGGSFSWNNGTSIGSSITVSPTSVKTYSVIYTKGCPSDTAFVTVDVDPLPVVTIAQQTICQSKIATLTAVPTILGGTYLWGGGSTNSTYAVSPLADTSCTVTYTTTAGCVGTATGSIKVNAKPTITVKATSMCLGQNATLTTTTSVGGGSYLWDDASTLSSLTVSPATDKSYSVEYTSAEGCKSSPSSGIVSIISAPSISFHSADTTICEGKSVVLTPIPSNPGGTFSWNNGSTGSTLTVSPTANSVYTVSYSLNCPGASTSITVKVNPLPVVTIAPVTVCEGLSVQLTANPTIPGGIYVWGDASTQSTLNVSPLRDTTYSVVYTSAVGCVSAPGIGSVTVYKKPTVTINNDSACPGGTAVLTASPSVPGGTYLWEDASTLSTLSVKPLATKSYSVVYTSTEGCKSLSTSAIVALTSVPDVSVNSTSTCESINTTLNASSTVGGGTYLWSNGLTGSSITVAPTTSTKYYVIYTKNCPSDTAFSNVTVNLNNTISAPLVVGSDNQAVCINTPISNIVYDITGATGVTISSTPVNAGLNASIVGTTVVISGTPTAAGVYSYTVALTGGCGNISTTFALTVKDSSKIIFTSAGSTQNQTVCEGIPLTNITYTLNGATGATVSGLPPGITPTISASSITIKGTPTTPSGTGKYQYTISLAGGCGNVTHQDSIKVNNKASLLSLNNTGGKDNPVICLNGSVSLLFASFNTTGVSFTGLPSNLPGNYTPITATANGRVDIIGSPNSVGIYPYKITAEGNCPGDFIQGTITVDANPIITPIVSPTVCEGLPVTLNAISNSAIITWDNGVDNNFPFVPTVSTYKVIADNGKCKDSVTVNVTINPKPSKPKVTPTVSYCKDEKNISYLTYIPTGTVAGTAVWYNSNGVEISTPVQNSSVVLSTFYTVAQKSNDGCYSDTARIDVTVKPKVTPLFTAADLSVCQGKENPVMPLETINNPSVKGTWTHVSTATAGPVQTTFTPVNTNGTCVTDTTIIIEIHPLPVANFTASPKEIWNSNPSTTMLNTSTGAVNYIWDFGDDTFDSISFSPTHIFSEESIGKFTIKLTAISDYGCTSTKLADINILEDVIYYIPNSFTPNNGDKLNDLFHPVFTSGVSLDRFNFMIFNRWGVVVFQSSNPDFGWDGKVDGVDAMSGTYTWKVEYKESSTEIRNYKVGKVNLLR